MLNLLSHLIMYTHTHKYISLELKNKINLFVKYLIAQNSFIVLVRVRCARRGDKCFYRPAQKSIFSLGLIEELYDFSGIFY